MTKLLTAVLLVVLATETGCAWLFQDRLHGGLEQYSARSEPHCSTSGGWAVVDGVFAGLNVIGVIGAAGESDATLENRDLIITSGVLWGLVHIASAVTGSVWADDCRSAYKQWNGEDTGGAGIPPREERDRRRLELMLKQIEGSSPSNDPGLATVFWCSERDGACSTDEAACPGICHKTDEVWCARYVVEKRYGYLCGISRDACLTLRDTPSHREKRSDFSECVTQKATGVAISPVAAKTRSPATPPAPAPRGFFCSNSAATPAAGFCTREKADCQRARDAAIAAVADLDECRLTEMAYCFTAGGTERCAPTAAGCADRALAVGAATPCDERH